MRRLAMAAACVVAAFALLLSHSVRGAHGTPSSPVDVYRSPCPLMADGNFNLWSSPATWPGGVVPGVGAGVGANVTIPCGQAVLLDVPAVTLGRLQIKGLLRVQDGAAAEMLVQANSVLVEGQLSIGTPSQHFRNKIVFELTPNTLGNRATLKFTSFAPAEPAYPRDLGHKAFAVVGGQLHLHGMPGGSSTPSWVRLAATANVGDVNITVGDPLAARWPVGGLVVLASTDYDYRQSETRRITAVTAVPDGSGTVLTLDSPLQAMHFGQIVTDSLGVKVDERGEVGLLSRNIVITGTDEPAPYALEGGHFIVFMTPDPPQFIEGVELFQMGQQGKLGRYSLHFHVLGKSHPETIVYKNAIHNSKQRCVVVHATDNLVIDSNVAYNVSGHCFLVEEGGEVNNTFINNLGIFARAVTTLIANDETDFMPSLFWMSNPDNRLINNVAACGQDSGYWYEGRNTVRGMSLNIPVRQDRIPVLTRITKFTGNVAHSNRMAGLRTYPNGLRPPRFNNSIWNEENVLEGMTVYKHGNDAIFIHLTSYVTVANSTFADNSWSVTLDQDRGITVRDSRFVALTENYGTPYGCYAPQRRNDGCWPIQGCRLPLPAGVRGRTGGRMITDARFGVAINVDRRWFNGAEPSRVLRSSFSGYKTECNIWANSAAIAAFSGEHGTSSQWNPSHYLEGLKFDNETNRIFFPARTTPYDAGNSSNDPGEAATFYTYRDVDGSVGGAPGSVVANHPAMPPPDSKLCTFNAQWNAYACKGVCYRAVTIVYNEPGFETGLPTKFANNKIGDWSYLRITRVSDGAVRIVYGNLNEEYNRDGSRFFPANLKAGETYLFTIVPSANNLTFSPDNINVAYFDAALTCGEPIGMRFQAPGDAQWVIASSTDTIYPKLCPGVESAAANSRSTQQSTVCINNQLIYQVDVAAYWGEVLVLTKVPPSSCLPDYQCSLQWSGASDWLYDMSGAERRPAFYQPNTSTASFWTPGGEAPFGWNAANTALLRYINTFVDGPNATRITYYFRRTFKLIDSACFTSLAIDAIVDDGFVMYLNGAELLRTGMPAGPVTSATGAVINPGFLTWQRFGPLPATALAEGVNTLAAEVHVYAASARQMSFDMRIVALRRGVGCSGAARLSRSI